MADRFFPVMVPDAFMGDFPAERMADGEDVQVRISFMVPDDWAALVQCMFVVIPDGAGNMRWGMSSNFGEICVEDYDAHIDSIAANQTTVQRDDLECIDIMAGLTGISPGDVVGVEFTRYASNILDTVDEDVFAVGVWISDSNGV